MLICDLFDGLSLIDDSSLTNLGFLRRIGMSSSLQGEKTWLRSLKWSHAIKNPVQYFARGRVQLNDSF